MDAKEAAEVLRHTLSICPDTRQALDLAIAALEREHAERWRSVEEEAPEGMVSVLVTCARNGSKEVAESFLENEAWYIDEDILGTVTHWRPMPAPAKEESRG